jgi:hypothetical protein
MATKFPSSSFWCTCGHEAIDGSNYCLDMHGGETPVMVGPLCGECFTAHRRADHEVEIAQS